MSAFRAPKHPPAAPGLALERTTLAWGRSSLSIAAIAGLILKAGVQAGHSAMAIAAAAFLLVCALGVWAFGRASYHLRRGGAGVTASRRRTMLRLVCGVSLASAAFAVAVIVA